MKIIICIAECGILLQNLSGPHGHVPCEGQTHPAVLSVPKDPSPEVQSLTETQRKKQPSAHIYTHRR